MVNIFNFRLRRKHLLGNISENRLDLDIRRSVSTHKGSLQIIEKDGNFGGRWFRAPGGGMGGV
jgi:hypothetical protein